MGFGQAQMRALIRESKRRPFSGAAYTLGRQTMALTPAETLQAFEEMDAKSSITKVADLSVDHTTDFALKYSEKETITDVDFFRMLGLGKVEAIDISDFEGAEIIVDLNRPIPDHLHETCDLLVDGSTLDNIFDPVTGLKNVARLLKPNGRALLINLGNYSIGYNGIPYNMFNPLWFFDYFAWNNFQYCQVYVTVYPSLGPGKPPFAYSLSYSHLARHWDPGLIVPIVSSHPIEITVFAEKGETSTWDLTPTQHAYRTEEDWMRYSQIVDGYAAQARDDLIWAYPDPDMPPPPGWADVGPPK